MKKKYLMLPILLGFMAFGSTNVMAETTLQEMAEIMLHLHHYPTDAEKERLQKIANDNSISQNQRTIASALMHMHHKVSDSDRVKLENIANNASAPADEREVADILANMHHKASAEAAAKLKKLE